MLLLPHANRPDAPSGHRDPLPVPQRLQLRVSAGKVLRDGIHVCPRLLQRHSRLKPADAMQAQRGASHLKSAVVPLSQRKVNICRPKIDQLKLEVCGNDSHDGIRSATQVQSSSQNVGRGAEFAFPEAFADLNQRRPIGFVLSFFKIAAQHRLDAENREKIGGDELCPKVFGLAHAEQAHGIAA